MPRGSFGVRPKHVTYPLCLLHKLRYCTALAVGNATTATTCRLGYTVVGKLVKETLFTASFVYVPLPQSANEY